MHTMRRLSFFTSPDATPGGSVANLVRAVAAGASTGAPPITRSMTQPVGGLASPHPSMVGGGVHRDDVSVAPVVVAIYVGVGRADRGHDRVRVLIPTSAAWPDCLSRVEDRLRDAGTISPQQNVSGLHDTLGAVTRAEDLREGEVFVADVADAAPSSQHSGLAYTDASAPVAALFQSPAPTAAQEQAQGGTSGLSTATLGLSQRRATAAATRGLGDRAHDRDG
jgi:hypothetical protein